MPSESGTCLIGSELIGRSNKQPRCSKKDIRILPKYNPNQCILEYGARCSISKEVDKLSSEEKKECINFIRNNEYEPKEVAGISITGNEISCEYENNPSLVGNQWIGFKGKIALSVLNKPFSKGGIYKINEVHVGTPKFQLK